MEDLGFALDADYVENQKYFMDDDEIPEVVIWLESHDDSRLWLPLFENFKKFKFTFKPASIFPAPDGKSSNGCSRLLTLLDKGQFKLSKYQAFCLDSDFKFTSSIADDFKGSVNSDPHIFWTLVHSKENIYLNPKLVDKIISHLTGIPTNNLSQNSEAVFQNISKHVYAPFSKILYLEAVFWGSGSQTLDAFKSSFKAALDKLKQKPSTENIEFSGCAHWTSFESKLSDLNTQLNSFLTDQSISESYERYQLKLLELGITPLNIYFFIRGHDWNDIVKELSCKRLEFHKKFRIGEISTTAPNNASEKIAEYVKSFGSFSTTLSARPPEYDGVPFFDRTIAQIAHTYS